MTKRKRKRTEEPGPADKGQRRACAVSDLSHPVLPRYFSRLWTLRDFLTAKLPLSSKKRRRRLLHLGADHEDSLLGEHSITSEVCTLLDETIIGTNDEVKPADETAREQDIQVFTQQLVASAGYDAKTARFIQSEIVDFVIWSLFRKTPAPHRPAHLLCHGYQRVNPSEAGDDDAKVLPGIPGVFSMHRNDHAVQIKGAAWTALLRMLGDGGDRVMMNLLLDASVFRKVVGTKDAYYQLSGPPLHVAKVLPTSSTATTAERSAYKVEKRSSASARLNSIKFVRSRMLFAKPSMTVNHGVKFGLPHIHILNKCSRGNDQESLVHLMKYLFPRQFKLHNVFTSQVNSDNTALATKDYTLREREISQQYEDAKARGQDPNRLRQYLPNRLKRFATDLVDKVRKRHRRCAYLALLRHYCPLEMREAPVIKDDPRSGSALALSSIQEVCFTDFATATERVSAFCRAAIFSVMPWQLWGDADTWQHNFNAVIACIDKFIRLRRFESLTLHQIVQNVRLTKIPWLGATSPTSCDNLSRTDYTKRQELFHEFVYYVFDSFLVPLIRSHFHVTESNAHKQRLFFFRHDVWRMLAEPALQHIKTNMFQEVRGQSSSMATAAQSLGHSEVRLLPKMAGARPIMNLRRRMYTLKNGKSVLGRSINSTLGPVFDILNYEKKQQSHKLGSSLFSVSDLGPRLRMFKQSIPLRNCTYYFCKVDVKSCFDSIPQDRLMELVGDLITASSYDVDRHATLIPGQRQRYWGSSKRQPLPVTRFKSRARPSDLISDEDASSRDDQSRRGAVYVDLALRYPERRARVLDLLRRHVTNNTVKIGRKFYRQKNGIPQGSIVSTLLCNFFYGELEREHLGFLDNQHSVLLRLLDDFLLITTRRTEAERFLQTMHEGIAEYGLESRPEKSLVNFRTSVNRMSIARPDSATQFPYCGILINTETLEISKNPEQRVTTRLSDGLTVDAKTPGQSFYRKTLNGFKIQLHQMFLDTSLNSMSRVLANLSYGFRQCALRSWQYLKNLPARQRSSSQLLIKTIDSLIALSTLKVKNANRTTGCNAGIHSRFIRWLAYSAFAVVFQRRQTGYEALLFWLDKQLQTAKPLHRAERELLEKAVILGARGAPV